MFVTIRQTEASGRNLFEVASDDNILYLAETPWSALNLPFDAENLRKLIFRDAHGNEIFHTEYNILDNTLQSVTQLKSLVGASTKLAEYQVVDRDCITRGSFYTQVDGIITSQLSISYDDKIYDCYDIALGKIYVVSIYDGNQQIAQLTKPLDTWNQLDIYYLYLLDEYTDLLPVLSFFTIYQDARQFDRAGNFMKYSTEKSRAYSFDTNNDKYNANWIADMFGQSAADQLNSLLNEKYGKNLPNAHLPKKVKHVLTAAISVAVIAVMIVVGVILYVVLNPKTAISSGDFANIMQADGFTVTALDEQSLDGYRAFAAADGTLNIQFAEFQSDESAENFYQIIRDDYAKNVNGPRSENSLSLSNTDKYTLTSGGTYYVVSRIDSTIVYCTAPETEKDAVDATFDMLGY